MVIKIINSIIKNNVVGISMDKDIDLQMEGTELEGNGKGLEVKKGYKKWDMSDPLTQLEGEIEMLYFDRDIKIQNEKRRVAAMPFIEGRIKNINEEYQQKIEPLERQRKYILEKKTNNPGVLNINASHFNNSGVVGQVDINQSNKNISLSDKNEGLFAKIFWSFIVPILVILICYYFFGIK